METTMTDKMNGNGLASKAQKAKGQFESKARDFESTAKDVMTSAQAEFREGIKVAGDSIKSAQDISLTWIKDNPLKAVAVTAGVGIALAIFLGRRSRHES